MGLKSFSLSPTYSSKFVQSLSFILAPLNLSFTFRITYYLSPVTFVDLPRISPKSRCASTCLHQLTFMHKLYIMLVFPANCDKQVKALRLYINKRSPINSNRTFQ